MSINIISDIRLTKSSHDKNVLGSRFRTKFLYIYQEKMREKLVIALEKSFSSDILRDIGSIAERVIATRSEFIERTGAMYGSAGYAVEYRPLQTVRDGMISDEFGMFDDIDCPSLDFLMHFEAVENVGAALYYWIPEEIVHHVRRALVETTGGAISIVTIDSLHDGVRTVIDNFVHKAGCRWLSSDRL